MKKQSWLSGNAFQVLAEDEALLLRLAPVFFGRKEALPLPSLSPAERARRRLAFRNERKFYHRNCARTGRKIISVYSPEKPHVVYEQKEWWSDAWDPLGYGREFDFSRSFFEQFGELLRLVPRIALMHRNSENCDYTNISADNKDCYILIESSNNRDCHYSYWMQLCEDCIDCCFCHRCTRCYEVSDSTQCWNLRYSRNCTDCRDSAMLLDCIGCADCIACCNLRRKRFCIFNEQFSEKAYREKKEALALGSWAAVQKLSADAEEFFRSQPRKYSTILNSEDCTGCYIVDAKDCFHCFHAQEARDCRYGVHVWRGSNDNMDVDTVGREAELNYECINTGISSFHNLFCVRCWTCSELLYCDNCDYTQNCFGCTGLRHQQYCILNRQYQKEDYEALVLKIIQKMKDAPYPGSRGSAVEWGEFFPAQLSCFGYNETVAQEYYPLERSEAHELGFRWREDDPGAQYQGAEYSLPDKIGDALDDVSKAILRCAVTSKPYKIIPQELCFYRAGGIALPRFCPDERHRLRMVQRSPREIFRRFCAQCHAQVLSPLAAGSYSQILCGPCYEKSFA